MTSSPNTPENSTLEAQRIEDIKTHLQILPNGFSSDYRNTIQVLYISMQGKYRKGEIYRLPNYEVYIDEKVAQLQDYYPDIDIRKLYTDALVPSEVVAFNQKVGEINDLVRFGEDEAVVKEICGDFMRTFFEKKVMKTIEDTLSQLRSALE